MVIFNDAKKDNHMNFKDILNLLKTWKFWKELLIMTLGMLVTAAAVYYFLLPSQLVVGSMTGLAMVISALFAKAGLIVKVSVIVTAMNAVLLILAWLLIGKEFGAKTVYTAMILGPCIDFWEKVLPYQKLLADGSTSVMGDIWFDLLLFVLLLSIAQAILFNINASTGGLDILAKLVNKFFHMDIGTCITIAGALIGLSALSVNPVRLVLIGLIGTWINGIVVDYFTAALNKRKRVCIISSEHEAIRKFIIEDLQRGCSLYEVTGGYSGHKQMEIQALLTQEEFAKVMDFTRRKDVRAFITAGNVSEVYGMWHSKHK